VLLVRFHSRVKGLDRLEVLSGWWWLRGSTFPALGTRASMAFAGERNSSTGVGWWMSTSAGSLDLGDGGWKVVSFSAVAASTSFDRSWPETEIVNSRKSLSLYQTMFIGQTFI